MSDSPPNTTSPAASNSGTEDTDAARPGILRVATWNVLADAYFTDLKPGSYATRFPGVARLEPAKRRDLVVERLLALAERNDLVFAQEVEPCLVDSLRLAGLEVTFHARGASKPDGIAEIRSREIAVVHERTHAFDLSRFGALRVWHRMDIDLAGARFVIAATHLEYDDGRAVDGGVGVGEAQLREMLSELDGAGGAQLIVGDLNAEPSSTVFRRLLLAGFTPAISGSRAGADPGESPDPALHPATNVVGKRGLDAQFATHADWILARGCTATRVREIAAVAPMPRIEMPSDHVPIEAEVTLANGMHGAEAPPRADRWRRGDLPGTRPRHVAGWPQGLAAPFPAPSHPSGHARANRRHAHR